MARPLLLAVAALCTSCTSNDAVAPAVVASSAALAQQVDIPADVTGVTGEGALYGMYVPANWNGKLVLWGHGYNQPSAPLTLFYSHFEPIRLGLLAQGYAVAMSSYSENGWAVVDGATRTHQLVGLFTARFRKPDRVYLIGRSMGSLVMMKLAESHPAQYDGILAYCGFLGGAQMFTDHLVNTRLLFELYYPAALPGDPADPLAPPVVDAATMVALARAAMNADPAGMFKINAAMTAIGMPLPYDPASVHVSLRTSIESAISQFAGGYDALVSGGHGIPFDNRYTDYQIDEVNDAIVRFQGHPAAMNPFDRGYLPSGKLRIPTVTFDIVGDNVTPLFHKDSLEARAVAAGAADMLFRMTMVEWNRHCPSTSPLGVAGLLGAFQTLVTWAETGVHP